MKYIIDAPSNLYEICGTLRVPVKVGEGDLCWYDTYLKAESYTESDRKAIEDEVWELADLMGKMSLTERDLCFGFPLPTEVTTNLTYQEAKSLFEKWMENENEIHVGDEIYSDGDYEKSVVMEIHGDGSVSVYTKNGCIEHWWNKMHNLKKTGRHFPEVGELLDRMREEE